MDSIEYLETVEKQITPVKNELATWLMEPNTYYQVIIAAVALLVAFAITMTVKAAFRQFGKHRETSRPMSRNWIIYRAGKLLFPFFSILILNLSQPLAESWLDEIVILEALEKVSLAWLLWAFLMAFVTNTLVRVVGTWILLPAAFLKLFGWFDSAVAELEEYGFVLGKVELTAYTFVKAIFFISIIMWLGKLLSDTGERYIRKNTSLTRPTKELLIKLYEVVLYLILLMITLNLIGIDLTALAVFSGALGVGLGFGLQKIASNFISGIILLTEKSININNLIEMDDGVTGYVRKLGARASIVETFDGKEVMVPNEDFITSRVANLTHSTTKGRMEIPVGVAYDTDLHQAYKLILSAAENYEAAVQDDDTLKPQVFLREYADNSVNFLLTFWLDDVTKGRWRAQSDVMFRIWDAFKEHDIQIPFPQRDLHLRSGFEQLKDLSGPKNIEDSSEKEEATSSSEDAEKV